MSASFAGSMLCVVAGAVCADEGDVAVGAGLEVGACDPVCAIAAKQHTKIEMLDSKNFRMNPPFTENESLMQV